jgi:hypothetical protein
MTWWEYVLWGAFGGLAVEAIEFYGAIRRLKDLPWKTKGESPPLALAVSVVIRVGVGLGLTLAAGLAGLVSGPIGAIAIGVAAPLLIEQMAKQVPLSNDRNPLLPR